MAQRTMKDELRRQKEEEDELYAKLWKGDRKAKVHNKGPEKPEANGARQSNAGQAASPESGRRGAKNTEEEAAHLLMELQKEQQTYRQYLSQQMEKTKEREMNKLIEAGMEKYWAKRAEQLQLEKEARNRLMKDVMDTRRLQIQEKLEENSKEQKDLARDEDLLERAVAEHKQLEVERNTRKRRTAQQQLLSQVAYHQQLRGAEKERREYEAGLQAENSNQQKLRDILSRPYVQQDYFHPLRYLLISSPKDWLP